MVSPTRQADSCSPFSPFSGMAPAWKAQCKHWLKVWIKRSPVRLFPHTAFQRIEGKVLRESWDNAQDFQAYFTRDLIRCYPGLAKFISQGLRWPFLEKKLFYSCFSSSLPGTFSCSSEKKHATQQWKRFSTLALLPANHFSLFEFVYTVSLAT